MAYSTGERFPETPHSYRLLDPGAYQNNIERSFKTNKAPFLSRSIRKTQPGSHIWTHAIYYADIPPRIPNCTSIFSNRPRFPYETLSKEDLELILCRCGFGNVCECINDDVQTLEVKCGAKIPRRLFKGSPPKPLIGNGLSAPSKQDHGFECLHNGSQKRVFINIPDDSPPFYDTRVEESTKYYQGCKWSRWTSTRTSKFGDDVPGPADYNTKRPPNENDNCAEKVRFQKRKASKQLRFIESVQDREKKEGLPGPATYRPQSPKRTELLHIGPKSKRFIDYFEQRPGPADHFIRRDFDIPDYPKTICHAKLPEPAFFGSKAVRFKQRQNEGPSPASYNPSYKCIEGCLFMHCPTAPFSTSAERFKDVPIENDEDIEIFDERAEYSEPKDTKLCPKLTWGFKSRSIRMKPLVKNLSDPGPADLPQVDAKTSRSENLQFLAPFYSSEGRFQPWHNWMNVLGRLETPGPGYYELEKPKCLPAVLRGPLVRSKRFSTYPCDTPAPNEYDVSGGVETVLGTHNQRLKFNVKNQHKFQWEPPDESRKLSYEEREAILLQKTIALLDVDNAGGSNAKASGKISDTPAITSDLEKPKLLRTFLYNNSVARCFI